jgi:hypothetical protein
LRLPGNAQRLRAPAAPVKDGLTKRAFIGMNDRIWTPAAPRWRR